MGRRSPTTVATGLVGSVASFWTKCAKQATKATRKLKNSSRISPKSPTTANAAATSQNPSKNLLATLSNKAIKLRPKKKGGDGKDGEGDEGVWQREIMMGDKCQPLDFSGVIYYDKDGKRMSEVPTRSPRASPLHQYAYQSGKSDW